MVDRCIAELKQIDLEPPFGFYGGRIASDNFCYETEDSMMRTEKTSLRRTSTLRQAVSRGLSLGFVFASALCVICALSAAAAVSAPAAAVTPCGNTISACGCTITSSGTFTVSTNLNSGQGLTANSDCIDIKAKNVVLTVGNHSITGPGTGNSTGAGIRVLKSASGTFIEGDDTHITAWNIGMEIDASNVITDWVQTQNNGQAGTFLNNTKNVNVNDFNTQNNSTYGVWIREGSNNQINCSNTNFNGKIGLYVGCHTDGTHGTTCKGFGPSKNNRLFDHSTDNNGDAGIVIDLGNTGNVVGDFTSNSNGGSLDSIDENPGCDSDVWLSPSGNYGRTNQGCIP
jgi:hypothetical protein